MELRQILAPLVKWWWLILLAAVLAGVSSYLAVRNEPDVYQARATLMTGRPFDDPNPGGSEFFLSQQLAGTYAEIARREPVRLATQAALGLDSLPAYDVRVPGQTQLLEITVTDSNPQLARDVANEVAQQLVQLSPGGQDQDQQELKAFVDEQLLDLAQSIEETQEEIQVLEEGLAEMFSAREIADAQNQLSALQNKLSTLQSNYTSFLASSQEEAVNVLTVVESASLPRQPVGPNKNMTIILSILLGTLLAAAAAYVFEYIDDSIESEEDIKQTVDLPILTSIEKNGSFDANEAMTLTSPRSPMAEAFRDLRTRILFLGFNKPLGTVLVTSAEAGEGKSFTASNLAVVMAQAGYRTLLIDGDLRRPRQQEIFSLDNEKGLSNLIIETLIPGQNNNQKSLEESIEKLLHDTPQGGLKVLTSGTIPPNPSELIGSNAMITIVETMKEKFDYIVMDSSPCLVVTDALLLTPMADSVIVVSNANQTRGKNLKKAVSLLEDVDANVVGVVLNGVPRISRGSYYYYRSRDEEAEKSFSS